MDVVLSRRTALAWCGACMLALAGCTSYGPETLEPDSRPGGSRAPSGVSGRFQTSAAAIPVGGGMVFPDRQLVITQPTNGDFKAFSAVCTHQGCTVAGVEQTINCDCHGSKFSITDGSVVTPPASAPLKAYPVTVSADTLTVQL